MTQTRILFLVVIVTSVFILFACGGNASQSAPSSPATSVPTAPPDYEGQTNPFSGQTEAVTAGEKIFKSNCASCHGDEGKGDGPVSMSLEPKPANLADSMGNFSDAYLFWRINEGGQMAPFHSAMPAWRNILSKEQIWQVITFLRTLGN